MPCCFELVSPKVASLRPHRSIVAVLVLAQAACGASACPEGTAELGDRCVALEDGPRTCQSPGGCAPVCNPACASDQYCNGDNTCRTLSITSSVPIAGATPHVLASRGGDLVVAATSPGPFLPPFDPFNPFFGRRENTILRKLDAAGVEQWSLKTHVSFFLSIRPAALAIGPDDAIYVAALMPVQFDLLSIDGLRTVPFTGSTLLLKLSPAGEVLWLAHSIGSSGQVPTGIALDDKGRVFVVGTVAGDWSFPGVDALTSADRVFFVVCLSQENGTAQWSRNLPAGGDNAAANVVVGTSGDLYFGGAYTGNADFGFGPVVASQGDRDSFVIAMSPDDGEPRWVRPFDGPRHDDILRIATDKAGALYITGNGNVSVSVRSISEADGSDRWARVHEVLNGVGKSVAVGPAQDVYVIGDYYGTLSIGDLPPMPSQGRDVFVARIDAATGDPVWERQVGSATSDSGADIAIVNDSVLALSAFGPGIDFGSGPSESFAATVIRLAQ
jgi:outer membrane protein assembly factor BamB